MHQGAGHRAARPPHAQVTNEPSSALASISMGSKRVLWRTRVLAGACVGTRVHVKRTLDGITRNEICMYVCDDGACDRACKAGRDAVCPRKRKEWWDDRRTLFDGTRTVGDYNISMHQRLCSLTPPYFRLQTGRPKRCRWHTPGGTRGKPLGRSARAPRGRAARTRWCRPAAPEAAAAFKLSPIQRANLARANLPVMT